LIEINGRGFVSTAGIFGLLHFLNSYQFDAALH